MVPIPLVALILVVEFALIFGGFNLLRWWQWREDRRRAQEERLYNAAEEAVKGMIGDA